MILFLLPLFITSCAYLSSDGEYVIERSKSQPPNWIEYEKGKFNLKDDSYTFVFKSRNYEDLPLGLKFAQQESLDASESSLKLLIDQTMVALISNDRVREVAAVKNFQDHLDLVVKDAYKKYVKIQDIYFEKLRLDEARSNELQEFYRVYTLQSFTKQNFDLILRDLATRCVKSNVQTVRKFGSDLTAAIGNLRQ